MFILLEEAGLKPNLGSYCAALECMGRTLNCSPKTVTRYANFLVNISNEQDTPLKFEVLDIVIPSCASRGQASPASVCLTTRLVIGSRCFQCVPDNLTVCVLAVCLKMVDLNQLAFSLLVEFPVIVLIFFELCGFEVLKVDAHSHIVT